MRSLNFAVLLLLFATWMSCNESPNNQEESSQEKSGEEEGWVALFNGENLDGWELLEGKTKFEAKDEEIVGTTVPNNPNSVLCTDKDYENFILELDIKVDSPLNSGVQIRSHVNDKGEVYGYQIEVDPSDRAWSGGFYDCRRRGWIIDLKDQPEKQKAFKNGEWNHYKIKANKDTIESWVNHIPIVSYVDTLQDYKGFIGLQADGNKNGDLEVRFKNIRIKEL